MASLCYMYGTARALPIHLFPLLFVFLFVLAPPPFPTPMAPIRWFSAEEKGKASREGPDPLPPKKRPVPGRRDEVASSKERGGAKDEHGKQ